MERYSMFMDWKNEHGENGHITESNIQIQCNQNPDGIFLKTQNKKLSDSYGVPKDPEQPKK